MPDSYCNNYCNVADKGHEIETPPAPEAPTGQRVINQWAIEELNLGPHAYQACALTT